MSAFFGLNTALRGLLAQQAALDVTGHNIANVNTEGYTRQRADLAATTPYALPAINTVMPGQIGTGVEVTSYSRLRDQFADLTARNNFADQGRADSRVTMLQQLEGVLGEPGDTGLSAQFQRFFAALSDVSTHPSDMTARQKLVQEGSALATRVNELGTSIQGLIDQADTRLTDTTTTINSIATQIAALNTKIGDSVKLGQQPNDLLDQRDMLMDQLSKQMNYVSSVDQYDQVTITVGSWGNLVDPTVAGGTNQLLLAGHGDLDAMYAAGDITTGAAFGLEDQWSTTLPAFQTSLDNMVQSFVEGMNNAQYAGFDLTGASGAGQDMFVAAGTTAITMAFDPTMFGNPALFAASDNIAGGVSNAGNALAMLDQRTTAQGAPIAGQTWEGAYISFVGSIGSASAVAQRDQATQQSLVASSNQQRSQSSGVSLDEEMTNMLRFQHAYNAAARVLTAMDAQLDTLINRTGRVGL